MKKDEIKEAEIIEEIVPERKAFFFPRLLAFVFDLIIVSMICSLFSMAVPTNKNYEKSLEELKSVQENLKNEKIDIDKYIKRVSDISYDLDKYSVPISLIQIVVSIGYFVILPLYTNGQTLGKKIMKLRIVSNDGEDLTANNYLIRAFLDNSIFISIVLVGLVLFIKKDFYFYSSYTIQGIQGIIMVVSLFMILYKKDGRGIHDKLANTKVVMIDKEN